MVSSDSEQQNNPRWSRTISRGAFTFIVLMGIVSMFSDMTHEGARSVLGEYLNLTGASAAAIGFVSGFGELCGYSLRLLSGFWADKTKHYWGLIIFGYTIQVLAIPALALVPDNGWIFACSLVVLERVGKAIKKPAKNTLVSFAADEIGTGKGFALQEFLDQLGAFLGPLLLFLVGLIIGTQDLFGTYRLGFLTLGIPAFITIVLTVLAWHFYPHPENFDQPATSPENTHAPTDPPREPCAPDSTGDTPTSDALTNDAPTSTLPPVSAATPGFRFNRAFALYMAAICLFAFGFADFTLITLHAAKTAAFPKSALALLYAGAMAVDAIAALIFGTWFDHIGLRALIVSTLLTAPFSAFVFLSGNPWFISFGIVLWGLGMGAQESIMKAAVAKIMPKDRRATGFGIFETGFGIAWFLGSWLIGALYDLNIPAMVAVSIISQLTSVGFYLLTLKNLPTLPPQ